MPREKQTKLPPDSTVSETDESADRGTDTPEPEQPKAEQPKAAKQPKPIGPSSFEVLEDRTFSYAGMIVTWKKGKMISNTCHDMAAIERAGVKLRKL